MKDVLKWRPPATLQRGTLPVPSPQKHPLSRHRMSLFSLYTQSLLTLHAYHVDQSPQQKARRVRGTPTKPKYLQSSNTMALINAGYADDDHTQSSSHSLRVPQPDFTQYNTPAPNTSPNNTAQWHSKCRRRQPSAQGQLICTLQCNYIGMGELRDSRTLDFYCNAGPQPPLAAAWSWLATHR